GLRRIASAGSLHRSPQRELLRPGRQASALPDACASRLSLEPARRGPVDRLGRPIERTASAAPERTDRHARAVAGIGALVLELGGRRLRQRSAAAALYRRGPVACRLARAAGAGAF